MRINQHGEEEVLDDKDAAESAIANYFTEIYKRPLHIPAQSRVDSTDDDLVMGVDSDDELMLGEDSIVDELAFSVEDILNAAKESNFNKGLGPDCFDGNILEKSEVLRNKVVFEIANSLNSAKIPDYLKSGRLVPLQKTQTKGPVSLDDIRPIVVRSHISKIMEKAILEKIRVHCPHLIETKIY